MSTAKAPPSLSKASFDTIAGVVSERSGLDIPADRRPWMESRLGSRLIELELDGFDQYVTLLTTGPYQNDEFQQLLDLLATGQPRFFDHPAQLQYFERVVLPELLAARLDTKHLRIWSAACGGGEEPYTLAIVVHQALGVRLADWHIEILGTDLSERRIGAAGHAVFGADALHNIPEHARRRYFKPKGAKWALSDDIRQLVGFEAQNLNDRIGATRHGTWDAIFCRNALPHFGGAMRAQVLRTFHERLAPDGTLLLGQSEALKPGEAPFAARPEGEALAYCPC